MIRQKDVAREIGLNSRVFEADVKELARLWEETVDTISHPSARAIFSSLRMVTRSYLRGQGLRMGNWQGVERYALTEAALMICLVNHVVDKGTVYFRALHQAGISSSSVESFLTKGKEDFDILSQVKQMLDGE